MPQLLEQPTKPLYLPPPRYEISEDIRRAKVDGAITKLGADALEGVEPELIKSVLEKSRSLGKPDPR